ncbi:MAG: guanylate kinase [Dehalococcoidia bacterium]|nr:guanylate kinase [Dehalococcoidia bacterium]
MSDKPVLIVLHGPSGVGKDSVVDELRAKHGVHRPTSSTSRKPRDDEKRGTHYHFYTRDEFMRKVEAGEFIEWAEVYGDLKGLERHEVADALAAGRDVIIRTDVQGARTWRERLDGAVFVVLVPEHAEALRKRLTERGSETEDSLARRLAELDAELGDLPNNDYVVENHHGKLDDAIARVVEIIERERTNPARPAPRIRD